MTMLPPGSTIGILGGGQLGRMLGLAAARLGYRVHIFAPESDSVAAEIAAHFTCADYEDSGALLAFAKRCDVVTYEFENVPVSALHAIAGTIPLHPAPRALEIAQDRADEKSFARGLGGRTAPFAVVDDFDQLLAALDAIGLPAIVKTMRFGYDGKGQARIERRKDAALAWETVGRKRSIVEGLVRFEREFSVLLVRDGRGAIRYWETPENRHEDGVLAHSHVPADVSVLAQVEQARALAAKIAAALDYVGVLTCEFFAGADGPVFNEMAPRVHNSGHWTIEGAVTSQFENHIRAVCGLPLGDTALAGRRVTMDNLIGDEAEAWATILADPPAHLHLYGKGVVLPGRKMGHVTRVEI